MAKSLNRPRWIGEMNANADKSFKISLVKEWLKLLIMVKNAGSKSKYGCL